MSCPAPGGGGGLALGNPQGLIDLGFHNGVNVTAERSDARHALSQAITPVWTAIHTWNNTGRAKFWGRSAGATIQAGIGGNFEQASNGIPWPLITFGVASFIADLEIADSLRLVGFGKFAAGAGTTRLRVNYGPTIVYDTTALTLNGDFRCEVYLSNQDNVNVVISVHLTSTDPLLPIGMASVQTPIGNNGLGIIGGPAGNAPLQIWNGYVDYFRNQNG